MTYLAPTYPEVVRDLLTTLTGGQRGEVHQVPAVGLGGADAAGPEIYFETRPVRRISHLQGEIEVEPDGARVPYRFTDRDVELIPAPGAAGAYDGVRFPGARRPAPGSVLVVNYYPVRLPPTPLNDVAVGSVVRTLLETVGREMAAQYQQLQLVYDSAFVETASGSSLDHVAALVDVRRLRRRHPVGRVRLTRRPGSPGVVVVPVDTAITDGQGNRYLTTDAVTMLASQSSVEVGVHGESTGTATVDAGALTVLERAIAGVDRAGNEQATWRAAEDETDDQLRLRARLAIHGTGRGTLDAIRSALEALTFVSAVSLTEMPDGVPGTLRVDVALTEDTPFNRSVVARRLDETRPAGIDARLSWAGRLDLALDVALTLAGSPTTSAAVEAVQDGVRRRLADALRPLAPGATLRRARLVAAAMADPLIADASVALRVGGAPATEDAVGLPAGLAIRLDERSDITFAPVAYESGGTAGPGLVAVDVEAALTLLAEQAAAPGARAAATERVRTLVGSALAAAAGVSTDLVQQAVAGEAGFVLTAAATVLTVESPPGVFVELRPGDPPFAVPPGATLRLRDVRLDGERP